MLSVLEVVIWNSPLLQKKKTSCQEKHDVEEKKLKTHSKPPNSLS